MYVIYVVHYMVLYVLYYYTYRGLHFINFLVNLRFRLYIYMYIPPCGTVAQRDP